jgi:hypothetical protein
MTDSVPDILNEIDYRREEVKRIKASCLRWKSEALKV